MSQQLADEAVATINSNLKTPKAREAFLAICDKVIATKYPFILIEEEHLTIKTKTAELKKFKLNKAQKRVLELIVRLWNEGKIIRLLILKARQLGISTLIEAIIYDLFFEDAHA